MIRDALIALVEERRDLTRQEAAEAMREMMRAGLENPTGEVATPAQFGAFMAALRLKGETVEEITGMAQAMREHALRLDVKVQPLLDTAGTGGSKKVFNASTAGAFVAAAAGAKVAKHGNRAMTSNSGAADFLEALGAQIALTPPQVAECIEKTGMGFMFAQTFHPAMKFAGPLRPLLDQRPDEQGGNEKQQGQDADDDEFHARRAHEGGEAAGPGRAGYGGSRR